MPPLTQSTRRPSPQADKRLHGKTVVDGCKSLGAAEAFAIGVSHRGKQGLPLLILLFIFSLLTTTLHADVFSVNKQTDSVARILQEKLPNLAMDRLFSAERGDVWWKYSFYINYDKTWSEVVEIVVRRNPKNNMTSDIEVNIIRRDGGLVSTKKTAKQLATSEWTAKIQSLIKDSQPSGTSKST